MTLLHSTLLAAPPLLLLLAGLIPGRWADRRLAAMRTLSLALLTLACGAAAASAALLAVRGPLDAAWLRSEWPLPLSFGVYYDSLAAVMLLLISFIGLVIVRYSLRYLDGEATQGRFLRWILMTLGAVLLLVVSRNLVMFTAAWMLTSFGLHQLLTHYSERPWAVWAARKKFLISRLGDLLLLAALAVTYRCFGSFEYGEVFAAAEALRQSGSAPGGLFAVIGTLYALGAMTKSAQFPFHSWLPDTMETPTPVSALMHAGIINAGGFLIIRLSPLICLSHLALDLLALAGALTALLGGVVMLTQTSVKRSLAYSTIAQMGFMMLQCGLGAFSAALLHIVAHSLYKAHAFLSSGSVLDWEARMRTPARPAPRGAAAAAALPLAAAAAVALWAGGAWLLGIDVAHKAGAGALGLILSLALTQLIWPSLTAGGWALKAWGLASAAAVSLGYWTAYLLTDRLLAASVSHQPVASSLLDAVVIGVVAAGFVVVFALQSLAGSPACRPLLEWLYAHASSGFDLDIPARRLTARLWGRPGPTP